MSSELLINQPTYRLTNDSNPAIGVHELSIINQTDTFDKYARYVQEQASRTMPS